MHMTRDGHAVEIEQTMVARKKTKIITVLTAFPHGQVSSVHDSVHGSVVLHGPVLPIKVEAST